MAKRFATVFFITLATAILCTAIFVLVLFMAPGMSVFGLKYIATNTHVVNQRFTISSALEPQYGTGDFSGSIRVEVEDIPVEVMFTVGWEYEVVYYDNYSGLTTSKIEDPSITCTKDDDGTAVIKVSTYKTFVYENGNSTRYVKLLIPASVVSDSQAGQTDITIKSNKSNVSFYDEKDDNFNPYFRQISVETAGNVSSSTNVKVDTFKFTTLNTITIGNDTAAAINATNYILNSTGGKIVVNRDVAGNIEATTKNASIKILSCNNFTANSGWGDISCVNAERDIVINGKANINTTAGRVYIGSILGVDTNSVISTKTGSIEIKKMMDGELSTTRGYVVVNSARNVKTTTSSGAVTVAEATASADVTTKRGKVVLGGTNAVLVNPKVTSTFGKVSVVSASGKVDIETVKANVEFINKDSEDITLKVSGVLSADKLKGKVNITVDSSATLNFDDLTENVTITNNGVGSHMVINLLNNNVATFAYSLEGTEAKLMEYNVEDPANHRQLEVSTIVTGGDIGLPKITVSSKGSMVVYCKMGV